MARPSKLTVELAERIALAVAGCASFRAAAMHAGVSEATFHAWTGRGRAERERIELATNKRARQPLKGELPYLEFLERIEQADAQAQVRAAAQIAKAGEGEWRANAWLLERRDPQTFGPPRQTHELAGSETPIRAEIVAADDRERSDAAREYLRRVAGD